MNTAVRQSNRDVAAQPRANLGSATVQATGLTVVPSRLSFVDSETADARSSPRNAYDVRAGRCGDRLSEQFAEVEEGCETRTAGTARRLGFRKARVQEVIRACGSRLAACTIFGHGALAMA